MKSTIYIFDKCGCRSLIPLKTSSQRSVCPVHKTELVNKEVQCIDCPTIFLTSPMANNVLRCPACALKEKKRRTTLWHLRNPRSCHRAIPTAPPPIEFKLGMVNDFPMGFSDEDIADIRSYEYGQLAC